MLQDILSVYVSERESRDREGERDGERERDLLSVSRSVRRGPRAVILKTRANRHRPLGNDS